MAGSMIFLLDIILSQSGGYLVFKSLVSDLQIKTIINLFGNSPVKQRRYQ